MAVKTKTVSLGKVTIVHASGIVETDKKQRSTIKAEKGNILLMDVKTKKVFIKPTTTKEKEVEKDKDGEIETSGGDE